MLSNVTANGTVGAAQTLLAACDNRTAPEPGTTATATIRRLQPPSHVASWLWRN